MATHPTGPKDPKRPQKSRHIPARALKHDARGVAARELMERDCLRVLEYLGAAPLRTITSESMRAWVKQQEPPWTPGYWREVQKQVQAAISERTGATGPEVKARLLSMVDSLIPECRQILPVGGDMIFDRRTPEYHRYAILMGRGTAWEKYDRDLRDWEKESRIAGQKGWDPPTEPSAPMSERLTEDEAKELADLIPRVPFLYEIDHGAVQGYLKLVGQLTGVLSEKHQHLHLHAAVQNGGDLSEVPEAELVEAERIGAAR